MEARSSATRNTVLRPAPLRDGESDLASASRKRSRGSVRIVGIGASAGGLEAFSELLHALSTDVNVAYVLVQHLDPTHRSLLSELLAKATQLRVREISDHTAVEPNQVYVIPPNCDLAVVGGVLHLSPRNKSAGMARSIDNFLISLAEDQKERAIGVILSGAGSDGAAGIKAIKENGGLTFAQEEHSAKYDSMPRSAINTGCVDFVLPPEKIAAEICKVVRQPDRTRSRAAANAKQRRGAAGQPRSHFLKQNKEPAAWPPAPEDSNLRKIFQMLRQRTGVDFSFYKSSTIRRRLSRRMQMSKVKDLDAYARHLRENTDEIDALYRDFLINVTSFFRNSNVFEKLKSRVFPRLLKARSGADGLRIWVAGCSTGQEAYSLAMAYTEYAEQNDIRVPIQIFASDINSDPLEIARAGRYTAASLSGISKQRLKRFFNKEDNSYRVQKSIRDMVVFAQQNLVLDPPFTRVDLITCRNLLIYLEPSLQQKVIPTFHYALKPNGYLVLGASESIGQFSGLFDTVDKSSKIYLKKPAANWLRLDRPPTVVAGKRFAPVLQAPSAEFNLIDAQKEADRVTLAKFAPVGVLVNESGEILQFRGNASKYLELPTGRANFHLFKMARGLLAVSIERAFRRAQKEGHPVRERNVRFNGHRSTVDVEVLPLKNVSGRCFLVLFDKPAAKIAAAPAAAEKTRGPRPDDPKVWATFKQDLLATRNQLSSLQEEHETSVEELQASNEEVQSANEELQSLNEELETSNEELESANEELTTLNEELATRNTELRESERRLREQAQLLEMAPLLARTPKDRIIFWSKGAEKMYGFTAEEAVGQSSLILLNSQFSEPLEQINAKLQRSGRWEGEVTHRHKDGSSIAVVTQWVLHLDDQKKVRAILEVNSDVTERRKAEAALRVSEEFNRNVLESSPDCIAVLNREGRVIFMNPGGLELLAIPDVAATANCYWPAFWEGKAREDAENALREALVGKASRHESICKTVAHGNRWFDIVIRPLLEADTDAGQLLCVARDITEHKLAQMATAERARLAGLRADIAAKVASTAELQPTLQEVTELLLRGLQAAFVRIWIVEDETETLVLKASSGMYTHLNGAHARIKMGQAKIGRIAQSRNPALTNTIQTDPALMDVDWAKREGITSFAGYPLVVADKVVGVVAMFGRHDFPQLILDELSFTATAIGQFVQRKLADETLRDAREELSSYAQNLERVVTERTASLRQAIGQMEEFSYSVSHDLRAPARAMQGYAKAVLDDYGERLDDTGRLYLDRIVRSSTRMDKLIQDILCYSRLSRREMQVQPVSLDRLIEEIIQHYPEMQPPRAEVMVQGPLDSALGHEPSLTQAISNLLSNAVKFVAPGVQPRARIWTERINGRVRLWIKDNGIGIKPEHQGRLFGMFERIHPDSKYEGTGIGLAIVRKAVERMNGRAGVESDGSDGSHFWIELPAAIQT